MAVQVNVAANQQALINSIQQGVNAFNRRFASKNTLNLNVNAKSFTQPLGRITGAVDDFGSAMAASNARVIAFGASTAVLGGAIASFRSLAKASIEVEKNLTDVNRILQLNTSTLQEFGRALFDISKRTATSFNDASKALLEFSRQGLSAEETLKRTNDALTLTRLAGLGAEASVAALTATVNGFSKSGITTTQVLNKLVAVEQSFAVSARDLSEGLARTGQAAQEAGVNIDQLNALISAAQQKTARGGAVIGNALKTIFTRLQRTDTLDQLERFDIAVRNVQGNILPATQILQNFANAYYGIADAQRAQLAEQVAGVYQVNVLKALLSDLNSEQSIYNSALRVGANATNEASLANAQLNQTLSALLVQVGNNAQQLGSTIGSVTFEPLAKNAAKAVNSIMEYLTNTITGDGIGSDIANGLLKGIRNVLAGPGAVAAFYTLFKLASNSFSFIVKALPQIAGITTETQKRQSLEQSILTILQGESMASKAILGYTGNQAQQAKILLGIAQDQTNQYRQQLRLAASLAGTLRGQGVSVGKRGLQTNSGGYIPASTKMAEKAGAFAGGYAPGNVVNSPVGGVMNTAEDVKYVPGFAQPFINPPRNSRAGKLHRVNAVKQVGIDPYLYGGFVPNFASRFDGRYGIRGLAGREKKYDFERYVTSKEFEKNSTSKTAPSVLAGRIFESRLQNLKFIDLFENISEPDVQVGPYRVREAKLSLQAGLRDPKVRSGKKVGDGLIVPSSANRSSEGQLNELGIDVTYAKGQTHSKLFGKARQLIDRYKYTPTYKIPRRIPLNSSGSIPNFAAGYRNPFTGELNNAAIARGLRSGKLTQQQAKSMGYSTSGSKIEARKNKRAAAVNALNYTMAYVPWDIEGFRGGRSGGRLNIAQGTAYEKFILNLLRSGKLKGTTSLGAPFALPARPDVVSSAALKGGTSARIDGYSLSAGEMYEMKAGDPGATLAGLQNKFVKAIENNPEILNPKRKWKNYIFRTTAAKGRGASGGFIPNLAYKGEVMDLEEFISGQKAIYSENPFPHVRNESQPTFASAIADHGGLSNALKDSYRNQSAAGLANGGYVPNFAAKYQTMEGAGIDVITGTKKAIALTTDSQKKLDLELKNLIKLYKEGAITRKELIDSTDKLADENKLTLESQKRLRKNINARARSEDKKRKGDGPPPLPSMKPTTKKQTAGSKSSSTGSKLDSGSLGLALAFAGPMVAGALEQALYGSMSRLDMTGGQRFGQSALSGGLTAASTGASVGAAFGAPGAILGGLLGAAIGLTKAFHDMELSSEELVESFKKSSGQQIEAATSYQKALSDYQTAVEKGDTEGQSKARENLSNILSGITDKNFSQRIQGLTNPRDIQDVIQSTRESATRAISLQQVTQAGVTSGQGSDTFINNIFITLGEKLLNFLDGFGRAAGKTLSAIGTGIKSTFDLFKSVIIDQIGVYLVTGFENALSAIRDGAFLLADDIAQYFNKFSIGGIGLNLPTLDNRDEILKRYESSVNSFINGFSTTIKTASGSLAKFKSENKEAIRDLTSVLSVQTFGFAGGAIRAARLAAGGRVSSELSQEEIAKRSRAILKTEGGKGAADLLSRLGGASTSDFQALGIAEGLPPVTDVEGVNVLAKIQEIANTSLARERVEKLQELTEFLEETEKFTAEEVQSLEKFISDASSEGNVVGQEFLNNLRSFIKFFNENNDSGSQAADDILSQVDNFTQRREQLQKEIVDFINVNSRNEIILAEGIKRQRLAIDEILQNTVDFGRPFEAIELRRDREQFNIDQDIRGRERAEIQKIRELSAKELNKAVTPESRGDFETLIRGFEASNASAQQRIAALTEFLEKEGSVLADQRLTFELQLQSAQTSLDNAILEGEQRRKTADYVAEREKVRAEQQRSMSFQFQKSVSKMNDDGTLMLSQLAFDAPRKFADGMANALSEVAKGTKSIGDAFTDMAIDFGRMLQQEVFRALAAKAVGSLLGNFAVPTPTGQTGGLMSKGVIKAQNGMYISGGRTGDRNLALLEDGEYVLNRNAVRMMGGPKSLDKMNFQMAPRFASGGYYDAAPEMKRKDGELYATGDMMFNDQNVGAIDPSAYSAFALENDEYFQDMRKKSRDKFFKGVQKRFEKAQKRAQMVGAIVGAIGGAMMAYGAAGMAAASSAATSAASTPLKASIDGGSLVAKEGASKAGTLLQGVKDGTVSMTKFTKFAARNPQDFLLNGAQLAAKPDLFAGVATRMTSLQSSLAEAGYKSTRLASEAASSTARSGALQSLFGSASNMARTGKNQKGGLIGYNSGGFVPHGSRLSDTIPAMLTGGEYIMNNKAVRKYGLSAMNQMNAGAFQSGGMSNSNTTNNNNTNNSTSIAINVDRSGRSVYGAQTNSYEKDDIVISKEMATQINNLVLKKMVDEKRYGGELYKNPLRT